MRLRAYLLLRAYLTAGLAIFAAGLPLFVKGVDTWGLCFSIGMAALCAWASWSCFNRARRTRDEERAYAPPADASVAQQITYYKYILLSGGIAFPALTLFTVLDLNSLQSGRQKSVMLWAPIAFLYNVGGYWLAVLSLPVLGLVVCGALWWKIRKLRASSK